MADLPPRTCLILGGADTLAADREAAFALFEPDVIIACNHAARDEPGRVDHWVTMHPEQLPRWIEARKAKGFAPAGRYWHARHRISPVEATPIESWGGSSGLLCVVVAFAIGCQRVVLAGVPMVKMSRHYDDPRPWMEARQYWPVWERRRAQMQPRVRSLSGWTRDLLGPPTREWIDAVAT